MKMRETSRTVDKKLLDNNNLKTLQAIGTIEYFLRNEDIDTVLVVCKKSLKYQWEEEFYKFIDPVADIFVIPDSKNKRYKLYDEIKKTNNKKIIITNYHTVLNDSKELSADMIVYDECHTAKNHKGKINKACRDITKKAQLCLFMTGTPVMSKPLDIYGIVSIKDNKYFSNSYSAFHKEYITMSYDSKFPVEVGYKNIDKLRDKIQTLILRRTSNEVDIDMPDVIEHNVFLDMDNYQEELYSVVKLEVEKHKGRINDILEKLEDDKNNKNLIEMKNKYESVLKGYIAIEQVIANNPRVIAFSKSKNIRERYSKYIPGAQYHSPKYIKFLDIVEESVEGGEKVIVFSKYETVVSHLADFLNNNKIKTVICHGGLNGEERNDVIRSFKFDDSVKVIIATDALAEGVNLNNASIVINFDLAFNDSINQQRIGRSRRAGSKHSRTTVYNLLVNDTIDISIFNKVKSTKRDFDALITLDKYQSDTVRALSN